MNDQDAAGMADRLGADFCAAERRQPKEAERKQAATDLHEKLNNFNYKAQPLPAKLNLSRDRPVVDYFRQFPGLDASCASPQRDRLVCRPG